MKVSNYKIVVYYVCFKPEVPTDFRTTEGCQTKNKPFSVVHLWNQTGAMSKKSGILLVQRSSNN